MADGMHTWGCASKRQGLGISWEQLLARKLHRTTALALGQHPQRCCSSTLTQVVLPKARVAQLAADARYVFPRGPQEADRLGKVPAGCSTVDGVQQRTRHPGSTACPQQCTAAGQVPLLPPIRLQLLGCALASRATSCAAWRCCCHFPLPHLQVQQLVPPLRLQALHQIHLMLQDLALATDCGHDPRRLGVQQQALHAAHLGDRWRDVGSFDLC